jgi:creatinine amidohydrolase
MTTTYGLLTWADVRDADQGRVVILNVSATEDHGRHLPLDTDTVLVMASANGVLKRPRMGSL